MASLQERLAKRKADEEVKAAFTRIMAEYKALSEDAKKVRCRWPFPLHCADHLAGSLTSRRPLRTRPATIASTRRSAKRTPRRPLARSRPTSCVLC